MAESNAYSGYTVEVHSKEKVAAVLPLQEHWLPLSNLDLLLPPLNVGIFFCYKKSPPEKNAAVFDTTVASLKASLAQALVTYYPFAGEVVSNSIGEPELLCNNRGVDFITAYADVELRSLRLHNPDESVEKKLVPEKPPEVPLSVQVTELACSGMVIACTFDHRVADAYSANMFLVAWSEISMKKPLSSAPSFRRSLLSPRRLGYLDPAIDRLYVPISSLKMKTTSDEMAINRIYYITAADIERMQVKASCSGRRSSKLEAFSAYLWKEISKGARKKRAASTCRVCRMGIVVNGRSKLKQQSETIDRYFGNVLSINYGQMGLKEMEEMALSEVAATVHEFVQDVATEEHFLSLIDWVEAHRPEPAATRIYFNEENDGVNFVVSSGREFPVAEVELGGWGRPVFGSYHFPWGGSAGYVMPMPSARGNGDWVVYMHLMRDLVEVLEAEAGDVFRPLTSKYVMGV